MSSICTFFYRNPDVLEETARYFTDADRNSLSLVNRKFYQMMHHAEWKRAYPQLCQLFEALFEANAFSEVQGTTPQTTPQKFFLGVECNIEELFEGSDAVPIDCVTRIARVIAGIVSLSNGAGAPSIPQDGALLVREVLDAARAYQTISKYLARDCDVYDSDVVRGLKSLPKHYLQHVFDLFKTGRDIEPSRGMCLLYHIEGMVCTRGDMHTARRICIQACCVAAKALAQGDNVTIVLYNILIMHMTFFKGPYGWPVFWSFTFEVQRFIQDLLVENREVAAIVSESMEKLEERFLEESKYKIV